jgi:general secretion pathway protein E
VFARHGVLAPADLWRPVGCERCAGTGHAGRFVIAEVHAVDDSLRELVTARAPLSALKQHAVDSGVESLQSAGLAQAAGGYTTFEELKRVVGSL